jgi:hypothetical protein
LEKEEGDKPAFCELLERYCLFFMREFDEEQEPVVGFSREVKHDFCLFKAEFMNSY